MIVQPVERAGFYEDGSMALSVTHALTEELEKQRSLNLGANIVRTLGREDYEKWSWDGCTRMNSMFLASPPDRIGYLGNNIFQVAIVSYLASHAQ